MRLLKFILAVLLLFLLFATKLFLYSIEPGLKGSSWFLLDVGSSILFFSLAVMDFSLDTADRRTSKVKAIVENRPSLNFLLTIPILLVLVLSVYLTVNKKSLDWDDVALYDARAIFLQKGISFSEMVDLSRFDDKNQYYYLLYPPFTSIAHYFWYETGIRLPISFLYSLILIFLGAVVFVFYKGYIGTTFALLATFLVVSNKDIFSVSLLAYTNLPFALFLTVGILLIADFLRTKRKWSLFLGTLLLGYSQFVRSLEPIWLIVFFAFLFVMFSKKEVGKNLLPAFFLFLLPFIQYQGWAYFLRNVAHNPPIFNFSLVVLPEAVISIFTGAFLRTVFNFGTLWGFTLLIHAVALIVGWTARESYKIFFKFVILFSILFYLLGLHFLSLSVDWWREMGGSLVRSSIFLIPISCLLIVDYFVKNVLLKTPKVNLASILGPIKWKMRNIWS